MDARHLYQEHVLEHYRNPLHFGHLKTPTSSGQVQNSLCGDELTLELKVDNGRVSDAAFTGRGCAISIASASMITDELIGKSIEELQKVCSRDVLTLLGIEIGPTRIKCALLILDALRKAIANLQDKKM
jgi:nitrogen fixation protein NifU and related proteins